MSFNEILIIAEKTENYNKVYSSIFSTQTSVDYPKRVV